MDSIIASPVVSLSLEKLTKANSLDYLHLVKVHNYTSGRLFRSEDNKVAIGETEPLQLTTKDNCQWELNASESAQPSCVEFNLSLVTPINGDEWRFQAALAIVNSAGKLTKLSGFRRFKTAGRPQHFRLHRRNLGRMVIGGDLNLFIWISQIPADRLSDESFKEEFDCPKAHFVAMQLRTRENLFSNDNGYERFASEYHIELKTFESIFDSPFLPTYFNYGDWKVNGEWGFPLSPWAAHYCVSRRWDKKGKNTRGPVGVLSIEFLIKIFTDGRGVVKRPSAVVHC